MMALQSHELYSNSRVCMQGFAERRQRALRDVLPPADIAALPTAEEAGAIASRAVKKV